MKQSNYLKTAIKAAKAAGKIIRQNYGKHIDLHYKAGMDFVTDIDLKAEKIIISTIKKNYPGHSVYGEESGFDKKESNFLWIIDPLDGTTNFTMSNPFFNTAIALVKDNEVIVGVVYNPLMDELFYAEKGKGTYLNGKKILVNGKSDLSKSVVTFCHGSKKIAHIKRTTKIYSKMKLIANHTRQLGAAALELAHVACGRTVCFYMNNMNAYDVAAGSLLVEEAGGKVTNFENKKFTINSIDIFASNGKVHKKVLDVIS